MSVEADAEPAPPEGPERRGVTFPALRGYLREEPELALGEISAPTLAELEAEVHWLTGAPVLAAGAVAVVCARTLACGAVLAGLERDVDATRGLTTPYALGAFGDPKGRVERAIWIVDPARGADAFQDLRAQAAAAALAFGPAKVPLEVAPCGDWGPLAAWAERIDGLTPAIADFAGTGDRERERVLAAAGAAERPLRAYLRRWVATRYCVQACWDDDPAAVQAALEAGADPALPIGGSAAEVAATPGSRAEEVLVQWRLNQQSHVDFVLEIRRYLEQVEVPPIPEETQEEDVPYSPYVTEHVEETGSLEGADWYNRLCRKYG